MYSNKHPRLKIKKTLFQLVLSCFMLLFYIAGVSTEASALIQNAVKGLPENTAAAILPVNPPNPGDLRADWWRYFDADTPILKTRIALEIQQLKSIDKQIMAAGKETANININRLNTNLVAYLDLHGKIASVAQAEIAIQKTYTILEWLAIVHQQRTLDAELQSVQEDQQFDDKRFMSAQNRFDSLTAAYLQSNDKVTQGINLMANWAELAVKGEQLRLQKVALTNNNVQLEQIVKESIAAENSLTATAEDLQQLQRETKLKEQELNVAHENFIRLAASINSGNLNHDENKAYALLFEQKLKHTAIIEAFANAVLVREKIEFGLIQLLIDKKSNEDQGIGLELKNNLDQISLINNELNVWRAETEREQGRTGVSLAALFIKTSSQTNQIISLTQQRLAEVQDSLLSLQSLDGEIHDARLLANKSQALIVGNEGALKSGLEGFKFFSTQTWKMMGHNLSTSIFKIGESPVTTLGIFRVLLIITLAWVLSHFVRRGLYHISEWRHSSSSFLYALGRLAHYLILITGISIGLSTIGVDLSSFALIAGGLSLGVGFGLQSIVSNFVSGLIILFERSLRIGDFIELSTGIVGEVRAINVRSTLIITPDMLEVLVPNSELVNGKVINWTLTDASRRIHIPFGVAYGSDKLRVREAALEAADKSPHTLKNYRGREAEVWLTNFGDSSLNFELVVWLIPLSVKKPQKVRADYYWELETAFAKKGIELPFPQRDIHIRSGLPQILTVNEKSLPVTSIIQPTIQSSGECH